MQVDHFPVWRVTDCSLSCCNLCVNSGADRAVWRGCSIYVDDESLKECW